MTLTPLATALSVATPCGAAVHRIQRLIFRPGHHKELIPVVACVRSPERVGCPSFVDSTLAVVYIARSRVLELYLSAPSSVLVRSSRGSLFWLERLIHNIASSLNRLIAVIMQPLANLDNDSQRWPSTAQKDTRLQDDPYLLAQPQSPYSLSQPTSPLSGDYVSLPYRQPLHTHPCPPSAWQAGGMDQLYSRPAAQPMIESHYYPTMISGSHFYPFWNQWSSPTWEQFPFPPQPSSPHSNTSLHGSSSQALRICSRCHCSSTCETPSLSPGSSITLPPNPSDESDLCGTHGGASEPSKSPRVSVGSHERAGSTHSDKFSFVNLTLEDSNQILAGVAPSGSEATRARRYEQVLQALQTGDKDAVERAWYSGKGCFARTE